MPEAVLYEAVDAAGDTRLKHPPSPLVERGTFDLRRLHISRHGASIVVEARFGAPIRLMTAPSDIDRGIETYLQTVDVYLDTGPGGSVESLPGRGFHVPASEAWDRVLVLSSVLERAPHASARLPTHLTHHGRVLRATFPATVWPDRVDGVLVTVQATARWGAGRVRAVSRFRGDCTAWDSNRCTLYGEGPPVIDASAPVTGPLLRLSYRGPRPAPKSVPVVFQRGKLVTVAPVPKGLADGTLATLLDGAGKPSATAVVQSVVGDSATLQVIAGGKVKAVSVVFGGSK